jgi:hypothetical protein
LLDATSGRLFLEAGSGRIADLDADLFVIEADFREGAITPAMAGKNRFISGRGEHFVRLRWDVHFFCPKMFAAIGWLHS